MKKLSSLLIVLLLGLLAGCSQQNAKESDGGVAAVVNGVEITKRQVEYLYQRSARPDMSADESANLKRRILADLVRLELLAGKGREMKLDSSPDYNVALYIAQKNVLASLAENKISADQPSVSSDQAESVVLNTPQLFAGRKLFVYDEVLFAGVDMPLLDSLDALAVSGAPLTRLLEALKDKKISFNKTLIALTSEKIPSQILSMLVKLKPNIPQVVAGKEDKVSMILVLREAYPIPLEGESARGVAMSMIASNQKNAAMSKAMTEVFNSAKITYYDEYSKASNGKQKLSPLPLPDTEKATKTLHKTIILACIFIATVILAIMLLTTIMRSLYSMLWLPRLWPGLAASEERLSSYEVKYSTSLPRRVYLLAMSALIAFGMIVETVLIFKKLSPTVIIAGGAGGIIAGIFASRLLQIGTALRWTRTTYTTVASVLALIIIAGIMASVRMISY